MPVRAKSAACGNACEECGERKANGHHRQASNAPSQQRVRAPYVGGACADAVMSILLEEALIDHRALAASRWLVDKLNVTKEIPHQTSMASAVACVIVRREPLVVYAPQIMSINMHGAAKEKQAVKEEVRHARSEWESCARPP